MPWDELERGLDEGLAPIAGGTVPPVVLFSGGLDSGLIAWELRRVVGAAMFTVGTEGAPDLVAAARAAPEIGLPWTGRPLSSADLNDIVGRCERELEGVPGPRRGIFVSLAGAIALAPPGVLVCGQGADELFLGYAHYGGLSPEKAAQRSEEDRAMLLEHDWPRTVRIARASRREIAAPYLHPSFVRAALRVPIGERLPHDEGKAVLRAFARHRGLPSGLADRPKRAVQYGSGVDRWLRRQRRARG